MEDILARAFTRVAQKACRNGEAGTRSWPPLKDLPAPQSWECVGRQYAREVSAELLEHCLPTGLVRARLLGGLIAAVLRRTSGKETSHAHPHPS